MSKYIKLEDAFKAVRDNTMPLDCGHVDRMRAIRDLPTIEVSEDCISREYMLKLPEELKGWMPNDKNQELWEKIKNAPSVVPSRAEGEWLLDGRCSNCLQAPLTTHKNFCPNCGAKMKG